MANIRSRPPEPTSPPSPDEGSVPTEEAAPAPETAAGEPAPAEETIPTGEDTDETEESDAGGPVTPIAKSKIHLRLKEGDEVGRLAMAYMKRNRDMTVKEATAAAEKQLGVKPEPAPAPEETPKAPDPAALPDTIEGIDSAIDAVEVERMKLAESLDFAGAYKLDAQLRKLERQRLAVEKAAEQAKVQEAATYDSAFTRSEAKAIELYEFAAQFDSPAARRMVEIEKVLQENEDPLFYSPDKPLRVAQMVAAEMSIAPRVNGNGKMATPVKAAPSAPALRSPPKQIIPGGNSGTAPKVSSQTADIAKIKGITTLTDLRKFRQSLGLPRD
jgi:hypothetical protein